MNGVRMYKVEWSTGASCDLKSIEEYLKSVYPPALIKYRHAFTQAIRMIAIMPDIAQQWVVSPKYRCFSGNLYPYKMLYHVDDDTKTVTIAAIVHGKQRDPAI